MHVTNITIRQKEGWVDLEQAIAGKKAGFSFGTTDTYYINNNGAMSAWFLNTDTLPTVIDEESGLELCNDETVGLVLKTGKVYVRVFDNNIGALTNLHIEKEG